MPKTATKLKIGPLLRQVRSGVKAHSAEAVAAAEAIGDFAELAMREFKSADWLERWLSDCGFKVTRPWKGMPTAFRASAGTGKPVIAVLAEYDALPDCGRRPGQTGHGCGHNLLGAAAALAGIVAAETLAAARRRATVVVLGCPAEEALHGKAFMAQLGAFRGLDAVLCWHPGGATNVSAAGGAAMDAIRFQFRGRTAHAAGAPESGRSALDAAVLTDVAVNYLREHVPENSRIHSVISDGGGAPNVVPDRAEIWYFLRGRDRAEVDDLRRRMLLCARGAAMATETRMKMAVETAITERIPNAALSTMLDAVLRRCGAPKFTPADARAAARLTGGKKYKTGIAPMRDTPGRASSDQDNVSWFAPLTCLSTACVPEGTTGHHRDYAAAVRLPGAHRATLKAGEVLAAAAVELVVNPPLLRKAQAEFRASRKGKRYDLPLPKKTPAVHYGRE